MRTRFQFIAILGSLAIVVQSASFQTAAATIKIKTGSPKTAFESYVINDAIGLMTKMFTDTIDTSGSGPAFDIVIGTQQNNTLISQRITAGDIALPSGKNADQGYALKTISNTIYCAAASDKGLASGIYDLLEQYGAYFQISSEALPAQSAFTMHNINKSLAPVFKFRGLLPWDNFLGGMSGWNEADYKLFIDRMVRMKFNIIQFHFYPGLAYYNEVYSDGSKVNPWFIADWANYFTPSQMIGSQAFGSMSYFGNKEFYDNNGTPLNQAAACQAMLKRVMDYAQSRGLATVAGFALMQPQGGTFVKTSTRGWDPLPDPLNAHNADLEVERYRRLVQMYPTADYYWMWQTEAGGNFWKTVTGDAAGTAMRNQYAYWCPDANHKGDIDYAYLFLQTVNKLTTAERSRIATGGWDVSRLFPGFDQDCPKEIIFHNMNSWNPPEGIRAVQDYQAAIQAGRRGWMTDWWEYDGLFWFPQFRVNKQEIMYKNSVTAGMECMSLDGWKQSGIEHTVRYLSEFSWNPGLTGKQFYSDFCAKLYGEPARSILSNMYIVYDSIEGSTPAATTGDYRDMNMAEGWNTLQLSKYAAAAADLNGAAWTDIVSKSQTLITKQQAYLTRDQNFVTSLKNLRPQLSASGQYWLDLMINRLEFRILYVEGLLDVNSSYVTYNTVGKASGITAAKTAANADLNNALGHIYGSIMHYSSCVRNTSDLGVIGQLNLQVYNILKKFLTDNGGTVDIRGKYAGLKTVVRDNLPGREISVYGIDGRLVALKNAVRPDGTLKRSGIYFFKVKNRDGNVTIVKKLVVNGGMQP